MGTNAEYYNNAYNTGVTEMYRGYIEEAREAAELTNKSLAERRSELQRIIRDLDSDIMSAQSAIESGQTTHFRAHMTARGDRVRAARAAARGRGAAGDALEKLRKDASKKAAASLQEAVEFAAAQGPDAPSLTTSEALSTLTSRSSMAGFLGQIGMVPGDPSAGRISAAERDAVSIGMREGIEIGLAANNFDATSGQIDDTAEQITGVSPTLQSYQASKNAAANQVGARTSSVSRGPVVTDADVDRALEESGLVSSIAQREADIERMQADRSAAMAAAAGLPGEMTEEQILQQAAGRMGDIGRYAGQPQNFIAVQRQLNDVRRRFAEQEASIAENETQRAAIQSMSPSQRILLQASLDGLDLKQRHPRGMPPELTEQSMDFSSQISNAMRNDPSLRGNDKAVVELAIHLAEQSNPDASVEEVRAMRDRILQGIVFEESKKQDVAAHFPEVQQAIHKRREEEIDALELAAVDPSEIKVEEVITEDDVQFRRPEMVSIEEQGAPFEFQRQALSDIQVEEAPFAFTQQAFERMTSKEQKEAIQAILNNPELMLNQQGMTTLNSIGGSQDVFKHMNQQEIERFKNIRKRVRQQQIAQFELQPSTPELVQDPQGIAALPLDPELEEQLLMQRAR